MHSVATMLGGFLTAIAFSSLTFVACGNSTSGPISDGGTVGSEPCEPTTVTECPSPPPHFADVAPIFQGRCAICHTGMEGGSWPLREYQHVKDWESDIRSHLQQCTMPPPDAGIRTTKDEQRAILTWIRCGGLQ